ncbi:MAG: ATP-binding cassette domain-containing protein [Actinomycetota bacterium]
MDQPETEQTGQPEQPEPSGQPIIELVDVAVVLDGRKILGPLSFRAKPGERWVVLGPNGGGKSTLMRVASLAQHPSEGTVRVLGHELGRVDIRELRARVGVSSASLVDQLRGRLTAEEVVRCGRFAALEPWWHTYTPQDTARAQSLLAQVGLDGYGDRTFGTLSSGERQRALLARTLMADPDVLILDEPTAGLDLGGREALIAALDTLAATDGPSTIFVTHHVEDIPRSTTHLLAIAAGRPVAMGPIDDVLSAPLLSELFGVAVRLERTGGRWSARAQEDASTGSGFVSAAD